MWQRSTLITSTIFAPAPAGAGEEHASTGRWVGAGVSSKEARAQALQGVHVPYEIKDNPHMKSTGKLALTCLAAALLLSAVASASASAAACTIKEGSKHYGLCVNGVATEGTVTGEAHGTAPLVVNLNEWAEGVSYECEGLHGSSDSLTASSGSVTLRTGAELSSCALHGTESKIVEECKTKTTGSLKLDEGPLTSAEAFDLDTTATLLEFELTGSSCAVRGQKAIQGDYECKMHEAKTEALEHELICEGKNTFMYGTGGKTTPITYKQKLLLTGAQKGDKFSVYES